MLTKIKTNMTALLVVCVFAGISIIGNLGHQVNAKEGTTTKLSEHLPTYFPNTEELTRKFHQYADLVQ